MAFNFRAKIGLEPSKPSIQDSALIVIDAQKEYGTSGSLPIDDVENSSKKIAETVAKFRKAKAPVIWVQHNTAAGAPVFDPEGDMVANLPGLEIQDGEKVITKHAFSAFTGTDLDETLKKLGKKQILLTGYQSHVCVTGTARSAFEHGYDTLIVQDAIGDRPIQGSDGKGSISGSELTTVVIAELRDAVGTIINSSDITA